MVEQLNANEGDTHCLMEAYETPFCNLLDFMEHFYARIILLHLSYALEVQCQQMGSMDSAVGSS